MYDEEIIEGLNKENHKLKLEIKELQRENNMLQDRIDELEACTIVTRQEELELLGGSDVV